MQKYLPQALPIFAPYVNSYRRLVPNAAAPTNVLWGYDNRTCGIRIPNSGPAARRLENRVPGVDVNPYLAMAATLACGYLGMVEQVEASEPQADSAYSGDIPEHYQLPRSLRDAIEAFESCEPLRDILGAEFVDAFCAVKRKEQETFDKGITSWERQHLQLHV